MDSGWLVMWIRRSWRYLLAGFVFGTIGGVAAGAVMSPAYRAVAVLTPAAEVGAGGAIGEFGAGLGGLAALAGVSFGAGGDRVQALEVLKSRELARAFIQQSDLLPVLVSGRRKSLFGPVREPTLEQGVTFFSERVLQVQEDRRTGVIVVAMTWRDPELAAKWANQYVDLANDTLRQRAIDEAARGRKYLEAELQRTQLVQLQEAAAGLIENALKTSMVANARKDFAFSVADKAVAPDPDNAVRPKRKLLAIAGAVVGIIAGAMCAWLAVMLRLRRSRGHDR